MGTIEPKAPGTRETIRLQYGPFTLAPGADASWPQVDVGGAEGYMVSAQPSIRFADGTEVGHDDGVHLHHAHLFRRDQDTAGQTDGRTGYQWIFGTGDEQTLGSFEALSKGDPSGKRYGVKLNREPMLMVWMPMNMTDEAKVVYLEFKFEFIHGSADAVEKATGEPIRPLQPVLYGETFNVPKTGGFFAWPRDAKLEPEDALGNSEADPEQFMTGDPARKRLGGARRGQHLDRADRRRAGGRRRARPRGPDERDLLEPRQRGEPLRQRRRRPLPRHQGAGEPGLLPARACSRPT